MIWRSRMRFLRDASVALVWIVVSAGSAHAATTGTISGVVRDKATKQVLPGVTVFVEGTKLGGIANDKGAFRIINVPAGKVTLRAKIIGYNDFVLTDVEVRPDFESDVSLDMVSEAIAQAPVVVEATRPLIQKDATGTTRFISGDDIQKLPTRGYRDAAAQQTGVVNFQRQIDRESQNQPTLIIRGGRPNETAYFVDGFSQQDPLTGTSSTAISNNAIEEVVVMTGGFNPEYGRIMSGAVNVVTREGAKKFFGSLEGVTDGPSGSWIGAPSTDYNVYDGSLGGPLIPHKDDVTFYVSGERRWQRDRSPSSLSDNFKSELSSLGLDDNFKPNNSTDGWTWQGKVAWRLNDQMNLKVGTLGSQDKWNEYLHSYLYNLNHSPHYLDQNQSYTAVFNDVFNKNAYLNVGATYFNTERKRGDGAAFDNLNPQYSYVNDSTLAMQNNLFVTPGGYYRTDNAQFEDKLGLFWDPGHVYEDYLQRQSSYWGLQGAYTNQVSPYHQLKIGGDFQRHTLRFLEHYDPELLGGTADKANVIDVDGYGYGINVNYDSLWVQNVGDFDGDGLQDTLLTKQYIATGANISDVNNGRDGAKHPKTFSLYAQDKYEKSGVIVNGGLRFDYLDVNTPAFKDEQYPLGRPGVDPNPSTLDESDLVANKTYARLSPRLGVAFPVDEKTLMRFNYGIFYQQPNLQDLYVSYRFLEYKVQTGGYFVPFGNPNLRPERTTAYEFGVARQVGDRIRLDGTIYWKDVKDLVEVRNVPSFPKNYTSFRNVDFATIKGLDLGFTMRPIHHVSANVSYSLSYASGTGSVSISQRNQAWTADQIPRQTSPLDFDQRNKVSASFDWRLGTGEGPTWGKTFKPLENAGVNVLFNLASGTPYTPAIVYNEVFLAALAPTASDATNSRTGPTTMTVDLKVNRDFRVSRTSMSAYIWVLNLFDRKNPYSVYNSSGSPFTTNFLDTPDGEQFLADASSKGLNGEDLYHLAETNPNYYLNPRLVRFGLRASF